MEASIGTPDGKGSAGEVFRAFLKLGLTAFGGPVAHLGYFRDELVRRRGWIDEAGYADLVALCQFLPGPASSQVGFALGWLRAGPLGALAAWTAFTLPSAFLLVLFALGAASFDGPWTMGALHGLKVAAVAVVAQAVRGMARTLTPDGTRAGIALAAVFIVLSPSGAAGQVAAIVAGGLAGLIGCRASPLACAGRLTVPIARRTGLVAFGLFVALLFLSFVPVSSPEPALLAGFYRSGALVFGGGHVVLPLLETATVRPGWIAPDAFLAGYGAAQAVPGPLFTFAAYLGALAEPGPRGLPGAMLCLIAVFLPGLLLVTGALPFWNAWRTRPALQAAMRGTNAAVVGILAAALYRPLGAGAIQGWRDAALALAGFGLLALRVPPWIVVALMALGGLAGL